MPAETHPVALASVFNAPAMLLTGAADGRPAWSSAAAGLSPHIPRGSQRFWGIPFELGPEDPAAPGLIELHESLSPVAVALGAPADYLCFLHVCNVAATRQQDSAGGDALAEYLIRYADGTEHAVPIRRRFEVGAFTAPWGFPAFAAMPADMPRPNRAPSNAPWGYLQTGVDMGGSAFQTWVYALENPHPNAEIAEIVLRGVGEDPVAVLGITRFRGPGHPLRHLPRKAFRLLLPENEAKTASEVRAELDLGVVTRLYAVPGVVSDDWIDAADRGLGQARAAETPASEFILEATGAEAATLDVKLGEGPSHQIPFGPAYAGASESPDSSARIEILNRRSTWVHVTVTDESTGKPTPTRAHFRGKYGEYIAPYGHHTEINDNWYEDYGGDLQLGAQSFAYVPGTFQTELPVGEVYVELNKGFEYAPLRQRVEIVPGQRKLELKVSRQHDLRQDGWVTADTHVHFISPQTAALEGKAEGLNLINLLASQWGRLFTNVPDITGEASGCSDADTIVWVGTENRNHLLGHISMLGTRGDPVFPMCSGGPSEAYIGDPDMSALTEWAQTCREREGVVIRPHFPSPVCEEPAYITLGQLDGVELRQFANPNAGALDEFCFQEWYRYLNCGYRVAAVGGTDKMSAGMPVGGVRTYARLQPDAEFSFASWGQAVRAGRTFTTSGPLIDMTVDGQPIGSEIQMGHDGGEVEIAAQATCVWPIHALEIVVNGKVVADARDSNGTHALALRERIKLTGSSWIAARCGSVLQANHCWPIHLGAHTSPVYVVCGGHEMFSPSDATYMLTLLDGGMTYLDTLSVQYSDDRHKMIRRVLERAQHELHHRLGAPHAH